MFSVFFYRQFMMIFYASLHRFCFLLIYKSSDPLKHAFLREFTRDWELPKCMVKSRYHLPVSSVLLLRITECHTERM